MITRKTQPLKTVMLEYASFRTFIQSRLFIGLTLDTLVRQIGEVFDF